MTKFHMATTPLSYAANLAVSHNFCILFKLRFVSLLNISHTAPYLCVDSMHKGILGNSLMWAASVGWYQVRPLAEVMCLVINHIIKDLDTQSTNG